MIKSVKMYRIGEEPKAYQGIIRIRIFVIKP